MLPVSGLNTCRRAGPSARKTESKAQLSFICPCLWVGGSTDSTGSTGSCQTLKLVRIRQARCGIAGFIARFPRAVG